MSECILQNHDPNRNQKNDCWPAPEGHLLCSRHAYLAGRFAVQQLEATHAAYEIAKSDLIATVIARSRRAR